MGFGDRDYYKPTGIGGFSFFPPVIKKLLIINAAMFFIQIISQNVVVGNNLLENLIIEYFGLIPFNFSGASFYPWQLISYQFLHGSFSHILFNMFLLWMFGMELENMWGSKKFLLFYLLCGIGAGLVQLLMSPTFSGGAAPTIGASGAVFGVMIAFAMYFPDRYIYLYFLIPVKAKYLIAFLVVIEFMSVGNMSFVAHLAHIGGAITGFVLLTLDKKYRFNVDNWFSSINIGNKKKSPFGEFTFRKPTPRKPFGTQNVEDAEYYEINGRPKSEDIEVTQEEIDRILDKISQSGYQNLTAREKKILFEASKKK